MLNEFQFFIVIIQGLASLLRKISINCMFAEQNYPNLGQNHTDNIVRKYCLPPKIIYVASIPGPTHWNDK